MHAPKRGPEEEAGQKDTPSAIKLHALYGKPARGAGLRNLLFRTGG